jgi:hypothetical protein
VYWLILAEEESSGRTAVRALRATTVSTLLRAASDDDCLSGLLLLAVDLVFWDHPLSNHPRAAACDLFSNLISSHFLITSVWLRLGLGHPA